MTEPLGEAIIRKPLMSGHCASSGADLTNAGHERCQRNGGYQRANPKKEFQPCPCPCHYGAGDEETEVYECGGCGREIIEAVFWPLDADGDVRYTHIDGNGKALGEDCIGAPVSRNEDPDLPEWDTPTTPVEVEPEDIDALLDAPENEDDDFIGLDPEPVPVDPEDEWDALLAEFDDLEDEED